MTDDGHDSLHPYGPDSHGLIGGDSSQMPDGYPIKGNIDSMLYHRPDSRVYRQTGAEVWFASDKAAKDAGFRRAGTHPKGSQEIHKGDKIAGLDGGSSSGGSGSGGRGSGGSGAGAAAGACLLYTSPSPRDS